MKLLLTGAARFNDEQKKHLEDLGHELFFLQYEKDVPPLKYDEIDGVIGNGLFLHHNIEEFTKLKYIQLTSAGYDRVPLDYIKRKGIIIHNAYGVYSIPMAEFAIASVLTIYKETRFFRDNQQKHVWEKHRGLIDLYGKKVCIVGCGNVGTECAKRFSAFGCSVIGVDIYTNQSPYYEEIYSVNDLDKVIGQMDIVIITVPFTENTKYLFNKELLNLLMDYSILINIARGGIVDTDALMEVLKEKDIYAVLDVFEEEPLSLEHPLWDMRNVFLTPHNSFVSDHNTDRLYELTIKNLKTWSKNNESKNSVDSGK